MIVGACCALTLVASPATASAAKRSVPAGFFGVMADGPLTSGAVSLSQETVTMRKVGVETVRVVFDWAAVQPYASFADVPPDQLARFTDVGGVPTDFATTDAFVSATAARGLRVLPVLIRAPAWAVDGPASYNAPPADNATFARFAAAMVGRYGQSGSFWTGRKVRVPIRDWQVWNEPNLGTYWAIQPDWAPTYAALLKSAATAIRNADRSARVVTAGLTNGSRSTAWEALAKLYAAGAKGSFDVVALHPYTRKVAGIIETTEHVRSVMKKRKDIKPIALTEISFSSSNGDSPDRYATWDTTESGQAKAATSALRTIAKERTRLGIRQVSWYSWLSPMASRAAWSEYSGLSRMSGTRVVRKPALAAYARIALPLEGRPVPGPYSRPRKSK